MKSYKSKFEVMHLYCFKIHEKLRLRYLRSLIVGDFGERKRLLFFFFYKTENICDSSTIDTTVLFYLPLFSENSHMIQGSDSGNENRVSE